MLNKILKQKLASVIDSSLLVSFIDVSKKLCLVDNCGNHFRLNDSNISKSQFRKFIKTIPGRKFFVKF